MTNYDTTTSERLGNILCRFHEDEDPSMGLYRNESDKGNVWYTYHCFACKASGHVPAGQIESWMGEVVRITSSKARPQLSYYWEDAVPIAYDVDVPHGLQTVWQCEPHVKQFLEDRNICHVMADGFDIRYHATKDASVWKCLDEDNRVKSGQVRFLAKDAKPKIIHVDAPRDPSPHWHRFSILSPDVSAHYPLVVAESYLDALSLFGAQPIDAPANVMTTLSTSWNKNVLGIVNHLGSRSNGTIIVCMDTDEAGVRAGTLYKRHLTLLGYNVILMTDVLDIRDTRIVKPYQDEYHEAFTDVLKGVQK